MNPSTYKTAKRVDAGIQAAALIAGFAFMILDSDLPINNPYVSVGGAQMTSWIAWSIATPKQTFTDARGVYSWVLVAGMAFTALGAMLPGWYDFAVVLLVLAVLVTPFLALAYFLVTMDEAKRARAKCA